jgi:cytochrome b6-f complex iron-sulfur subunit
MTESRRAFIGRAGVVLGGVPIASLVAACATMTVHRVSPDAGQIRLDLQSMPELSATGTGIAAIQIAGQDAPFFIVRQNPTVFLTLSSICTHRGCTVEAKNDRFECPCHGSRYSRFGDVIRGPAEEPLRRYRTALLANGRTLVIDVPPS